MTRFPTAAQSVFVGEVLAQHSSSAGKTKGTGSTGTATATWPASSARRPQAPHEPTPSWANGTDASPDDAATNARSWPSGAPCSPSSGTYSPTTTPDSPTSGRTTSPSATTPTRKNATTSASSKPSATPSPSPQQPDPQHAVTRHHHTAMPTCGPLRQLTIIFGVAPCSLRVTPRRRENGVGLPADADVFLGV